MIPVLKHVETRLNPSKNGEVAWVWIFLPALFCYLSILQQFINSKPSTGSIEVFDASFEKILYPSARKMEIISSGHIWTEGPAWMEDADNSINYLLYSDTRQNRIFRWEEGKGLFTVGRTLYMDKSGCKNDPEYCEKMFEPGSNGILRLAGSRSAVASSLGESAGKMSSSSVAAASLDLLVCQHGERAISFIRDNGTRTFIATHYKDRRFNSPNDLVWSPEGHLYFTDPPYGLFNLDKEIVNQELAFSGVYMIKAADVNEAIRTGVPTKNIKLLDKRLSRPNGIAFSPDFSKLYVSNSDPTNAFWKVYTMGDDGSVTAASTFFNATDMLVDLQQKQEQRIKQRQQHEAKDKKNSVSDGIKDKDMDHMEVYGVPDGMKVDINGNLIASGPGGVLVISPTGKLIGRFRLDRPVSNVQFGGDGRLYFTASDQIIRVWINTKPVRTYV